MLTGATLGQIADLLGSYMGFKSEVKTSGRFKYDHKLVVFLKSSMLTRSDSELPRNVPEKNTFMCLFSFWFCQTYQID